MSDCVPSSELNVDACLSSGQVFRFKRTGDGWRGVDGPNIIEAKFEGGKWSLSSKPDAYAYRRFFQLDADYSGIIKRLLRCEPRLAAAIARHPGLRTLRCERPDETFFSFLCTPNNNIARITGMVNALARYGDAIEPGLFEFPTAKRLATISEHELREHGFGYRAHSIVQAARRLCSLPESLMDGLKSDYLQARTELSQFRGVGLKVADCVCLFGLHHSRAVPIDIHIWRAGCALYFTDWKGMALTPSRYLQMSEKFYEIFGELAGWAQQFLFYSAVLDSRKPTGA